MHRSGTSLVGALLAALGVFMGPECEVYATEERLHLPDSRLLMNGYAEAVDFRSVNDGLLSRAGATWDQIQPFLDRRDHPGFARRSIFLLQAATFGRLYSHYLRHRATAAGPWGWKDPRSSLTLPYWLSLFPEARILHVRRDPEAVVDSLHQRALAWRQSPGAPLPMRQRLGRWLLHPVTTVRRAARRAGIAPAAAPDPCLDREHCRTLCRQYLDQCLGYRRNAGNYLEVSYEQILDDPPSMAGQLAEFAESRVPRSGLLRAAQLVRKRPRKTGSGIIRSHIVEVSLP
jgi:hypothetical protein